MELPGKYDALKASQADANPYYGKANLSNHDSNHLGAFPDVIRQLALAVKTTCSIGIWFLYGQVIDKEKKEQQRGR